MILLRGGSGGDFVGYIDTAFQFKCPRPLHIRFETDESDDLLVQDGVRSADDGHVNDIFDLEQGAFNFEWTDQMPGGIDDIIRAAYIPEITFFILVGQVARNIAVLVKFLAVQVFLVDIGAEHGSPALFQGTGCLVCGCLPAACPHPEYRRGYS